MAPRIVPSDASKAELRIWARTLPDGVLRQLEKLAAEPYLAGAVAAMPDAHVANGISVGTVFVTLQVVVPGALGGDLGCGVAGIRFPFPAAALSRRELEQILLTWKAQIPVGDAVHRKRREASIRPAIGLSTHALEHAWARLAPRHLGTLGGGNHFIELDRDGAGDLWLLVHSGSRGVGAAIATHHQQVASAVGTGSLPGLDVETHEGRQCLADLDHAVQFAAANRRSLLEAATEAVFDATGTEPDARSVLDVGHNFVRREDHGGQSLLVHRKGAIPASAGARAIIPGSMGTATYVVEGLGNAASWSSASHGAGRFLTRREARDTVDPRRLEHAMRRVVFDRSRLSSLVEEAPAAYREITEVLEDEADLVRPIARLEPIAVLKG